MLLWPGQSRPAPRDHLDSLRRLPPCGPERERRAVLVPNLEPILENDFERNQRNRIVSNGASVPATISIFLRRPFRFGLLSDSPKPIFLNRPFESILEETYEPIWGPILAPTFLYRTAPNGTESNRIERNLAEPSGT